MERAEGDIKKKKIAWLGLQSLLSGGVRALCDITEAHILAHAH